MSILCYHAVDPHWKSPLSVTPEEFERHCAWLARERTVVPLDVALVRMSRQGRLPRGMVALTFDDGFVQLQDHVFPLLAKYSLPATVFVVAATLTPEGHPVDWVDTPPDWQLETLSLTQVEAAQEFGVDVQSHSWSHTTLTDLDEPDCVEDLRRSRELIEDLLHRHVEHLAYPRGRQNAGVRRAAERAGYSHSFSLPEEAEAITEHSIPRVGIFPGNGLLTLRGKTRPEYLRLRHSPAFPLVRRLARRPA